MSQPFIGEIKMFAGNFAPRNYAFCNGQLMAISQNTALFAILGTTYGGNGTTTFGLPDLRGRVPVHAGSTPGLSTYALGEMTGVESTSLLSSNMPMHSHAFNVSSNPGDKSTPVGNVIATVSDDQGNPLNGFVSPPAGGGPIPGAQQMAPQAVGIAGGSLPFSVMQPYLCVSFIVALFGVFPARN